MRSFLICFLFDKHVCVWVFCLVFVSVLFVVLIVSFSVELAFDSFVVVFWCIFFFRGNVPPIKQN